MNARKISILGSTGSIGRSTLDVVTAHPGKFDVVVLAAYSNTELLADQCRRFRPRYACLVDSSKINELRSRLGDLKVELLAGKEELVKLAGLDEIDLVVNAVVGAAGLLASLEALKKGKPLALANKESLVAGGPLFPEIIKKSGGKILPIDSEHSALWQSLTAGKKDEVRRLIITASGGPFRHLAADKFDAITPARALDHPTWKMGPKISIDSATLANKGLEVIEAVALFDMPVEKVSVVIHPESIVHSMVEYIDSSIIAQLSSPDMRLPITYAMFWPDRMPSEFGRLEIEQLSGLTFEPPDLQKFGALRLAFEVAKKGGTAPAVFNAANEVAVESFLSNSIKFTEITDIIDRAVETIDLVSRPELEDILEADRWARELAHQIVESSTC
ncbi:MAG: 1-deoxy-D-xylulose-5-phosphate reductoisomerase [candidate division Zixibacteria bacterium]|nr:1-deoxy-D-xylulose-5-phosphate reductoisomerase [candidate division Zixibacteria bacterium]